MKEENIGGGLVVVKRVTTENKGALVVVKESDYDRFSKKCNELIGKGYSLFSAGITNDYHDDYHGTNRNGDYWAYFLQDNKIVTAPANPKEAPQYAIPTGCDVDFDRAEKGQYYVVKIPYKDKDRFLGLDGKPQAWNLAAAFKTEEAANKAAMMPGVTVVPRKKMK